MKYIFDLADTLVSSAALNSDAYNYALEKYGYIRRKAKLQKICFEIKGINEFK